MRTEADAVLSLQRYVSMLLPAPWDVRRVLEAGRMPERPYALVSRNATTSGGRREVYEVAIPFTVHLYPEARETRQESEDQELALRQALVELVEVGLEPGHHRRVPLWDYTPREAVQRVKVTAQGGTYRLGRAGEWTMPIAHDATAGDLEAELGSEFAGLGLPVRVVRRGSRLHDVHFETAGADEPLLEGDGSLLLGGTAPAELEVTHVFLGREPPHRSEHDFMRVDGDPQVNTVRDQADPRLMMVALDLRCTFARSQPIPSDSTLIQSYRLRFEGMR